MRPRIALIYAGFGALVAALTQALQIAITLSTGSGSAPVHHPSNWLLSAGAGIVAAGIAAALPWLRAVLPAVPEPPKSDGPAA